MAVVLSAATDCAFGANSRGVDTSAFDRDGSWEALPDHGGYRHLAQPVVVILPKDADGIGRICEVQSTLASGSDQQELEAALRLALHVRPVDQGSNIIWIFDTRNGRRGLQFFRDQSNEHPNVRLIGAAF